MVSKAWRLVRKGALAKEAHDAQGYQEAFQDWITLRRKNNPGPASRRLTRLWKYALTEFARDTASAQDLGIKVEPVKTTQPLNRRNAFAHYLLENQTRAEKAMRMILQWKMLKFAKWQGSFVIGPYFADFASLPLRIVIEVDGGYHREPAQRRKDERRECYLRSQGWDIMRFPNEQVLNHPKLCHDTILRRIMK